MKFSNHALVMQYGGSPEVVEALANAGFHIDDLVAHAVGGGMFGGIFGKLLPIILQILQGVFKGGGGKPPGTGP